MRLPGAWRHERGRPWPAARISCRLLRRPTSAIRTATSSAPAVTTPNDWLSLLLLALFGGVGGVLGEQPARVDDDVDPVGKSRRESEDQIPERTFLDMALLVEAAVIDVPKIGLGLLHHRH